MNQEERNVNEERLICVQFQRVDKEKWQSTILYVIWDTRKNALHKNSHRKASVFTLESQAIRACRNLNTRDDNQTLGSKENWNTKTKESKKE
jgi:hypothetical protein